MFRRSIYVSKSVNASEPNYAQELISCLVYLIANTDAFVNADAFIWYVQGFNLKKKCFGEYIHMS